MSLITDDPDITSALAQLDRALTPAPTLAAKAMAEYRERGTQQPTPWVNQTDTGAPLLNRDAILHASEPNYAPRVEAKRRRRWWGR